MAISVIVPTIPTRADLLLRAVASIAAQTHPVTAVVVMDKEGDGAAPTLNRGLAEVDTEWVTFLGDDDEMLPQHIERMVEHQIATGADLVYPWFVSDGRSDPLGCLVDGKPVSPFGVEFGPEQADFLLTQGNFIPAPVLVRTEMVRSVGGFPIPGTPEWPQPDCEDWCLLQRLLRAGAVFSHLPERTWIWHFHPGQTGGKNWKEPN